MCFLFPNGSTNSAAVLNWRWLRGVYYNKFLSRSLPIMSYTRLPQTTGVAYDSRQQRIDPNVRHTNRPYLSAWQDLTNTSPSYRSPESAPFDQSERTENLYPAEKHVSFPPFNIASTCWPTGQEGYEHSGPPTILPAYFADKLSAPPFSSDSSQLSPVIEQSAVQPSAYASYMSLGNHRNHTPLDRQTDHIFFGNHEPLTPFDMPAFQMSPGLHHPQMNPAMYSADALCRRNYCAPSSTGKLGMSSKYFHPT